KMADITAATQDPMAGGEIVRFADDTPTGILKENITYDKIYELIPSPSRRQIDKLYQKALAFAYRNGVTGVHSFDGSEAFTYFSDLAEKNALGLRINYYFPVSKLPELHENKIYYGSGTDYLRLAGIKIFADGSLGSQTALCFNKYIGSKGNYGIEVTQPKELMSYVNSASRLGFPCAVHAIGDKAVANVLDAFEKNRYPDFGARHRIEHLQLVRKKDLNRIKRLGVVASMQPSHCPADIKMIRKYWGKRGDNAYIFRTIIDKKINLAFGSDAPIEPLKPIEGIAAAVRRALPKSRDVLNPKERISSQEALFSYTVGSAIACGQEHSRGYLMPGYPADFVILSDDITKISPSKVYNVEVLATVIDGKIKYRHHALNL
ncbi:MAG: amidohydrolase, partial [FCB group bacterium]|nr:amidohydrolase [FCB group bacterium]